MLNTPSLPRAVLFDWDNTLVDTWPVIHEAMNTTLLAMGAPIWSLNQTKSKVRLALREAFPALFGDKWEEARDIYFKRFREIHLDRLESVPQAESLLAALADRNIYLAVVSNKTGVHLRQEAVHLGWNHYFGQVIGATDARQDKPARDPVDMALKGSGISAGPEVWFIGDTETDILCGHNAGCVKVLVRKVPPDTEEFSNVFPDMYFMDCGELSALVSRI